METRSLKLIKQLVNSYSSEGKLISQSHYGSEGQLAFTLTWKFDRLGHVIQETNALGAAIYRNLIAWATKSKNSYPT